MERTGTGTREWSEVSKNCFRGCSNNCRYCYSRYDQVIRYKRVKMADWPNMILTGAIDKKHPKYDGTVMFPTTHDITQETLLPCIVFLHNLLRAGNEVLVVSKPDPECIKTICNLFSQYKEQILFRFTIGAMDDRILSYWEPNAPHFKDRLESLGWAYDAGYQTSVSIEPMLESRRIGMLIYQIEDYVTETIWIGKMNDIDRRVEIETIEDAERVNEIKAGQTDERILAVFEMLKDNQKIRWKDSIKKVVGS